MTLPSQTGGVPPTEGTTRKPNPEAYPSSPISNVVSCNPKRTWICRCGSETDQRCARCGLPICDLTVRECAWHYCPDPPSKQETRGPLDSSPSREVQQ